MKRWIVQILAMLAGIAIGNVIIVYPLVLWSQRRFENSALLNLIDNSRCESFGSSTVCVATIGALDPATGEGLKPEHGVYVCGVFGCRVLLEIGDNTIAARYP